MQRQNLVITRAGAQGLHPLWLEPASARNFDLLIAAYDKAAPIPEQPGVTSTFICGPKIAGWRTLLQTHAGYLARYRSIALIDDDVRADAEALSRCFDIGRRYGLAIWQPALSWDSYFSHAVTLANPRFLLRYVNFVESMCPFFSREALMAAAPLFALGYESGIDLIWCSLLPSPWRKCAVIDAACVTHTRPVGVRKAENGFVDRDYSDDIRACLEQFRMRLPTRLAYAGIARGSGSRRSQLAVALSTVPMLRGRRAFPNAEFPKMLSDHVRHSLTRRPVFNPDAPAILRELSATRAA